MDQFKLFTTTFSGENRKAGSWHPHPVAPTLAVVSDLPTPPDVALATIHGASGTRTHDLRSIKLISHPALNALEAILLFLA